MVKQNANRHMDANEKIAHLSNFQNSEGKATNEHRFFTGFYSLTIMAKSLRKREADFLVGLVNTNAHSDEKLIVNKRSLKKTLVENKENFVKF